MESKFQNKSQYKYFLFLSYQRVFTDIEIYSHMINEQGI